MDMNGSQRIEVPRDQVYAALNDVEVLRQSIPGCDSIEKISATEMNAQVTLRIGPVKATFAGKMSLSELDPPNGYTITGEGSGGMAGFAKAGVKVRLDPDGEATVLNYTVNAEIGGKIAQLGARLIDGTAKKFAADFFERFSEIAAPSVPVAEAATNESPAADDDPEETQTKKSWWGKLVGKSSAAIVMLLLSSSLCCINGHRHEIDDPFRMPMCSTQTPWI